MSVNDVDAHSSDSSARTERKRKRRRNNNNTNDDGRTDGERETQSEQHILFAAFARKGEEEGEMKKHVDIIRNGCSLLVRDEVLQRKSKFRRTHISMKEKIFSKRKKNRNFPRFFKFFDFT